MMRLSVEVAFSRCVIRLKWLKIEGVALNCSFPMPSLRLTKQFHFTVQNCSFIDSHFSSSDMKLSIIRGVRLAWSVKTDDTSNKSSEQSSVNC